MKYTKHDLELYRMLGDEKMIAEVEADLNLHRERKRLRARRRREARARDGKAAPLYYTAAERFMVQYLQDMEKLLGLQDLNIQYVFTSGGRCSFNAKFQGWDKDNPGQKKYRNSIHLGRRWIQYWEANPDKQYREYRCCQYLLVGLRLTGRDALRLGALHELAHAVDFQRNGRCHHHESIFQHIYMEILEKYGPRMGEEEQQEALAKALREFNEELKRMFELKEAK